MRSRAAHKAAHAVVDEGREPTSPIENELRTTLPADALDDWWGLRAGADGSAAGYPVFVFGVFGGNTPICRSPPKSAAR